MNSSGSGLAAWLQRLPISKRLGFQSMAAIVTGVLLIATVAVGSFLSFRMIEKDNAYAEQALFSALLEKDFASLERDVFRHALVNDADTRADYEGNTADLGTSINDTRGVVTEDHLSELDTVESLAAEYGQTVESVIAAGRNDKSGAEEIMGVGDQVDAAIETVRDGTIEQAHAITAEQQNLALVIAGITVLIVLVTGVVSTLIAGALKRMIGEELGGLRETISRIEAGDLDVVVPHVERSDEIGDLARAAERLRDARRREARKERETKAMVDAFSTSLDMLSQGDLTVSLPDLGEEYGQLRQMFNTTVTQLHDAMNSVAQSAGSVTHGSVEIKQASDDLARRTEAQAVDLSKMTEAVGAMSTGMTASAASADEASSGVESAMAEAQHGGEIVARAVTAMGSIENSTTEIGKIISVIDGFSFQTSLLALNAGVEAARAGEVGRGFAVVANEVRELAQRSSDAAEKIRQLIGTSIEEVASGGRLVRETGEALDRIIQRISDVAVIAREIRDATSAHAGNLDDARQMMSGIDYTTQQNAAMAEQSNAAANRLAEEADNLAQLVTRFRLARGAAAIAAPAPRPAASAAPARPAAPRPAAPRPQAPAPSAAPVTVGNLAVAVQADDEDWSEF